MGAKRYWRSGKDALDSLSIPEPNSGCWLWFGCTHPKGYGYLSYSGKTWKAHRLSWTVYRGPIPEGMCVCHKCDVRWCVNPDHLFLGTNQDNVDDKMRKGRYKNGGAKVRGENNSMSRLTTDLVRLIRTSPEKGCILAKRLGVAEATITRVRNRILWRHIP